VRLCIEITLCIVAQVLQIMTDITKDTITAAVVAFEKLEVASGRNAKTDILKSVIDNEVVRELIKVAHGGDVYRIVLPKDAQDIESGDARFDIVDSFTKFKKLTSALKSGKLSGNRASEVSLFFLSTSHPRIRKWYLRAINHDFRFGVGKSTLEGVFGKQFLSVEETVGNTGLSWYYNGCMTAKKYAEVYKKGKKPEFPQAVEMKLDGERALLFVFPGVAVGEGSLQVLTRGKKHKTHIENVANYAEQVSNFARKLNLSAGLPENDPIFIDGEFLARTWNDTASIVGRSKNFSEDRFLQDVRTILWDWAPLSAYTEGVFSIPWKKRKSTLMKAAGLTRPSKKMTKVSNNLFVLGHHLVYTVEELDQIYDAALDRNFEGVMLKCLDAPHVFHRNHSYIVKIKPEDEKTGVIVDVLPGDGANGAASDVDRKRVYRFLSEQGEVVRDGYFLHLPVDSVETAKKIVDELKQLVQGDNDNRISTHKPGFISYRYSCRLGRLVVEKDNEQFRVGTGYKIKAGNDERMDFWQRRAELIGVKIDFKAQRVQNEDVLERFNSFVRLREDL